MEWQQDKYCSDQLALVALDASDSVVHRQSQDDDDQASHQGPRGLPCYAGVTRRAVILSQKGLGNDLPWGCGSMSKE